MGDKKEGVVQALAVVVSVFLLCWLVPVMVILVLKTDDGIPATNFLIVAFAATHLIWRFALRRSA